MSTRQKGAVFIEGRKENSFLLEFTDQIASEYLGGFIEDVLVFNLLQHASEDFRAQMTSERLLRSVSAQDVVLAVGK